MITLSDESWATTTLRDAQDPGAGAQEWKPLTRITLERFNLIFSQVHTRGYASTGLATHDAATALENGFATLLKVVVGGASNDLGFTKWSQPSGLEYDDVSIVAGASVSDGIPPSMEVTAGVALTIRVFYVDEDDDNIFYKESVDGGGTWTAETDVGAQTNLIAMASVSPTKVHCVSYANGNSRFHYFEDTGSWAETNSAIYWPHQIDGLDAITIGDRDLIVFYSLGPVYGNYREAGIYGIWEKNGRWSDIFKIDALDEHTAYSYRKHPRLSTANDFYFLTGWLSEGDADYNHPTRFLKISKDGESWSQYRPLVTCPETGPAMFLVVNAASGGSWPWSTGQQVYLVGFDKVYESDATRLVGEINTDLQVDVTSRVVDWKLQRSVMLQATTLLSNHDGGLDAHSIINADNTLLLKREAGYYTGEGAEYAQYALEEVDYIRETDRLPQRHKNVASRDRMKWMRDNGADHFEEWESQLVGYDNYHDDTETGYGGLSHTATQRGWWKTENHVLWLRSENKEGIAFATWGSRIMNGQVKAMIRLETASNGEYAGVIFRARDAWNMWAAYYDETTDTILLRQKIDGEWQAAAAASAGALGWSVDTWYGIMVDFRYSYIRVYRSTDGDSWTEDFNYTIPVNSPNVKMETGYVGLLGYGYSDQDTDYDASYDQPPSMAMDQLPDDFDPSNVQSGGGGSLESLTVYAIDQTSGRIFRCKNAFATSYMVYWENKGVLEADGLRWMAIDPFNKNRAMVIADGAGDYGAHLWRTFNLSHDAITWQVCLNLTLEDDTINHVCASPIFQNHWECTGSTNTGQEGPWVRESDSFGSSWLRHDLTPLDPEEPVAGSYPTTAWLEMSYYNASVAWCTWHEISLGNVYVTWTQNGWATFDEVELDMFAYGMPTYHRYQDNAGDDHAIRGGSPWGPPPKDAACYEWTSGIDGAADDIDTILASADTVWVTGCRWRDDAYYALVEDGSNYFLYFSDDCETWTLRYTFDTSITVRMIEVCPTDPNIIIAATDGTYAPLRVSVDGGYSFDAKRGNWGDLGYDGDIPCVAAVWNE